MPRLVCCTCLALLIATPLVSGGQTIRGIVRENSGTPLAGVLMTLSLDDKPESTVVSTLTNALGAFSLRAPQPGRYRLGAKRIGVRRFESEAIDVSAAQEIERDVALEALAYRLPAVTVRSHPLCVRRADQSERVASLWDEAADWSRRVGPSRWIVCCHALQGETRPGPILSARAQLP